MRIWKSILFAALLFLWAGFEARSAQFGYTLFMPTNMIVGTNFTTTLVLTNDQAGPIPNVKVSFTYSADVQLQPGSGATLSGRTLTFPPVTLTNNATSNLVFTLKATQEGPLVTTLSIITPNFATINTNFNSTVFGFGELGVSVKPPASVIVGDLASYSVTITNAGSMAVPGIFISNSLPAGVTFNGASPTNATTNLNGAFLLTGITLGAATSQTYNVFFTPSTTGQLALVVTLDTHAILETNFANNVVTNTLNVVQPDTNQLSIVTNTPVLNRQTGLYEQTVTLSNPSTNSVDSVRLIVVGLYASNRLYNASGTNSGNPFVVYPNPLAAGASANAVLEFYYPARVPQTNLSYITYGVGQPDLRTTLTGTLVPLTVTNNLAINQILIEFKSTAGKSYRVVYSDEAGFTNALLAQPLIVAPANRTQWIDDGPPKTISPPASVAQRFYKVFEQ